MTILNAGLQAIADNVNVVVVGYLVVFVALAILYMFFKAVPKVLDAMAKARLRRQGKTVVEESDTLDMRGPEAAAIAMALHLYLSDQHDEESNIITIKKISRRYSPWSSKLYGMREIPTVRRN